MQRSKKVALLAVLMIAATWPTSPSAGASAHPRGGVVSASFYAYDSATRLSLNVRRSRFDASDGLQRWEVWLLAMDPSPGGPSR